MGGCPTTTGHRSSRQAHAVGCRSRSGRHRRSRVRAGVAPSRATAAGHRRGRGSIHARPRSRPCPCCPPGTGRSGQASVRPRDPAIRTRDEIVRSRSGPGRSLGPRRSAPCPARRCRRRTVVLRRRPSRPGRHGGRHRLRRGHVHGSAILVVAPRPPCVGVEGRRAPTRRRRVGAETRSRSPPLGQRAEAPNAERHRRCGHAIAGLWTESVPERGRRRHRLRHPGQSLLARGTGRRNGHERPGSIRRPRRSWDRQ